MDVWKQEIISRVEHDISLVRFAHLGYILVNTRNKFHISTHPCIIFYVTNLIIIEFSKFIYYCNSMVASRFLLFQEGRLTSNFPLPELDRVAKTTSVYLNTGLSQLLFIVSADNTCVIRIFLCACVKEPREYLPQNQQIQNQQIQNAYQGSRSAILDVAHIVFITKNPGAS